MGEKFLQIFNLETKKGANIKKLPYANSDANKLFIFAIIEFSINMHMFAIQHLKQTLPAVLSQEKQNSSSRWRLRKKIL